MLARALTSKTSEEILENLYILMSDCRMLFSMTKERSLLAKVCLNLKVDSVHFYRMLPLINYFTI